MKRLFFLLPILAVLIGCKDEPIAPETATITIRMFYDSGRFPTKGISEGIVAALPTEVELTLTHTDSGTQFNVVTGNEITLPVGPYSVEGVYNPTLLQGIVGTTRFTSRTPKIIVSDVINVAAGTSQYSVGATYGSFAVGVLTSEVSAWTGRFKNNIADVEHNEGDGVWWIFVTGTLDATNYFFTTITPAVGEQKSFSIHTSGELEGGLLAEFGKWYILHPDASTTQSGTFDLNLPDWTSGQ